VRLIDDFVRQKPERMVYHYTNAAGLIGILKSKSIWATSHLHLNDRLEFKTAAELFEQELAQSSLTELQQRFFMRFVEEQQEPRFVMSFSEHHDLLSQWRAYGGGEGYALGFSEDNPIFTSAKQVTFGLVKCVYERAKQLEFCGILISEFQDLVRSNHVMNEPDFAQQFRTFVKQYEWNYAVALLSASFKHEGFREEGEWRLVSQYPDRLVPKLDYRTGRFGVTPYFAIPLSLSYTGGRIDRLVIGPNANRRAARESLKSALLTHGFDDTEIDVSNTPLRQ
jgi:Protein of unknown function (DUF2971)